MFSFICSVNPISSSLILLDVEFQSIYLTFFFFPFSIFSSSVILSGGMIFSLYTVMLSYYKYLHFSSNECLDDTYIVLMDDSINYQGFSV